MKNVRKIVRSILSELAHNPPVTFLYHGTSDVHLDSIMAKGLQDPYLTSDYEKAGYYADEVAQEKGGEPIVLKVRVPSNSKLRVDFAELDEPVAVGDDWDDMKKKIQKAYKIYVQENPGAYDKTHNVVNVNPKDYWVSLSTTNTVRYNGVIPSKNIQVDENDLNELGPLQYGESAGEKLYFSEATTSAKSFSTLTDDELNQIAKWGLQNDFQFSGCWDDADDDLDIAARCAVDDFKTFLKDPYPQGFKGFPTEPVLYRFITAPNKESIRTDHLGLSWFADPKQHETNTMFFGSLLHLRKKHRPEGHKLFLISARVPMSKIDIPRTIWQRSANWNENEVVLKDDSNLKVVHIQDASAPGGEKINEWWSADEYPEFTDGQFNPLFKAKAYPPVVNMNTAPLSETEISQEELHKKDLPFQYPDMLDDFILAKSEAEIREIAPTINLKQNPLTLLSIIQKSYPSLYDNFAEWIYEKIKGSK